MNENNLENADLDGNVSTDSDASTAASEDTGSEVSTVTEVTSEVADVAVPNDTAEDSTPAEPAAVTVTRAGAGRKVDTTGKTALGKARLLYTQNSTLTPKQLKQLFEVELPAAGFTNVTPAVCQTYASLVRKKKAA